MMCVNAEDCGSGKFGNATTRLCEPCPSLFLATVGNFECVASKMDCGRGNIGIGQQCKNCKAVNNALPYATSQHDSCVAAGSCDNSLFGSPDFQCVPVSGCGANYYAQPITRLCVLGDNCGTNYYPNPDTQFCELCPSGSYLSLDKQSCVPSKIECGNGSSVPSGLECILCKSYNPSNPYATVLHDNCVAAINCGTNLYGNS